MLRYWEALKNALIDRSPQELIGAIAIALLVALVVTGLYELGRRKIKDGVMLMTGLVLLACVVSMALTAGFFTRKRDASLRGPAAGAMYVHPWPEPDRVALLARRVLERADRNGDGLLSDEEAADAAGRFVREGNINGTGPLNIESLTQALRASVLGLPPMFGPGGPAGPVGFPFGGPDGRRGRGRGPSGHARDEEPKAPSGNAAEPVQDGGGTAAP